MIFYKLIFLYLLLLSITCSQIIEPDKIFTLKTDTVKQWKWKGVTSSQISQAQYSNWSAGGQNAIAISGLISISSEYTTPKSWWENQLNLAYGIQRIENEQIRKTDDKIDFLTRYSYKAFRNGFYSALLSFRTQFTRGYDYPNDSIYISDFLAPAYIMIAGGLNYKYKGEESINLFLAPLTGKITIVRDTFLANQGAYGVQKAEYDSAGQIRKPGKRVRYEFGGYLRLFYEKELLENVKFQIRNDFFSNYLRNPGNIDINGEAIFNMKVNKILSATLTLGWIYDDDIIFEEDTDGDGKVDRRRPRLQFKEVLGVGLNWTF